MVLVDLHKCTSFAYQGHTSDIWASAETAMALVYNLVLICNQSDVGREARNAPTFRRGSTFWAGRGLRNGPPCNEAWGFSGLQLVRVVYNINSSASCHAIMKFWTSLFLCFSLLSGALAAQSSPSPDRFEKYQALSRSSPVELESSSFVELTTAPRDYYAVVLLTALDARYGCVMCREFDPEWNLMARSWNKGSKPDDLKVVFGTLDFDNGKAVFQKVPTCPTLA